MDAPSKPYSIIKLLLPITIIAATITFFLFSTTQTPQAAAAAALLSVRAVLPCSDKQPSLPTWTDPPTKVTHNMTDTQLFWAASMVPQIKQYPYKRRPKVAFMFLTRGPLPLAPSWERFFHGCGGRCTVYVHGLPGYKAEFKEGSVFHRRYIPSKATQWGRMSMCDAERRLLANALLDLSNERFILLSESCIPLYNFSIVYQYLMKSRYSFLGAFDDPSRHGRGRYDMRMEPEVKLTQWRKGAQWFEVNREVAINIVSDTKYYSKFDQFCKPACYVDEHYFPTMLTIQSPHLIANRTVTWVDWSRGGPHPATFGKSDITEAFLKKIIDGQSCLYNGQHSSICFLFARKFAPNALESLLPLAPKVLGFG